MAIRLRLPLALLLGVLLWGGSALGCAAQEGPAGSPDGVTLEVEIPALVAGAAARRLAGEAGAPAPILVVEGLEIDPRQSLTLTVRGPRDREKGVAGPILATTGTVGAPSDVAAPERETIDLAVPLAGATALLLEEARQAGRRTLEIEIAADRPLHYRRVRFKTPPS